MGIPYFINNIFRHEKEKVIDGFIVAYFYKKQKKVLRNDERDISFSLIYNKVCLFFKIMRYLITGGAGFVGHHFVEHFLKTTDAEIIVLDALNYASMGFDRLRDIDVFDSKRISVLSADFSFPLSRGVQQEIGQVDYIFHLGAESHVDNSITDPKPFVMSNVVGTMNMLEVAKIQKKLKCFFYFSTDEVFGPAPNNVSYEEDDRHRPTNPYSATKSGGEMLVKAYQNTYKIPCIITRSMNIFGERQHPEKYIPLVVNAVLSGDIVTIHSNPEKTQAGSRFYIHARNVADAYSFLLKNIEEGQRIIGEDYHITGEREVDNLELAQMISRLLGKELRYEMVDYHSSRPGHDLRYCLDGQKIFNLGWVMPKSFEQSLQKMIEWTLQNPRWLGENGIPKEVYSGALNR
jgi:dTDP-glucose 4,6-dehydratase